MEMTENYENAIGQSNSYSERYRTPKDNLHRYRETINPPKAPPQEEAHKRNEFTSHK